LKAFAEAGRVSDPFDRLASDILSGIVEDTAVDLLSSTAVLDPQPEQRCRLLRWPSLLSETQAHLPAMPSVTVGSAGREEDADDATSLREDVSLLYRE
jgi:hypothetical protein